ncbi:saccharopine dehydrogenase NADP-binding domain-containing protein [Marinicella sp. S1101]|uniref:saccharopine dehydrogenase NADP-binding domain-containing protein n=1 Tax=Marinicella marina TaxID=2996016 RepID=UPI002260F83F|nr:saccharopine dehydrogenase NADP-binding domain-containing protein [Marinicella marina]MCX7553354.1 saccharopine dehydrogenase NADP-binding domain-containing protein [Marinicella marina]MDJ1139086.1 saccharopine dehydrogenase NADP-binding domain-containing protein [Marinicella marina]
MNTTTDSKHVLVLGGYGTFGSRIVRALCDKGYLVTINGRHFHQAQNLKLSILAHNINARVKVSCFDVGQQLKVHLNKLKPDLVIHTCGPFQGQDTTIARTIIKTGAHCIDLADSRDYVNQMSELDALAQSKQVSAITAASTVPALSSAALTYLKNKFKIQHFNQVDIGISPGQRTPRGLATTQAVLSYLGKPMRSWQGNPTKKYGWMDTYLQTYPNVKERLMSNCEAPDLDLLPGYFNIKKLSFAAGMESKSLHRCIGLLAWLIRLGVPLKPEKHAQGLLKMSRWFDRFGSCDGGMHVHVMAEDGSDQLLEKTWFIEAFNNHGPQIPAVPAIVMADKILTGDYQIGVLPCVNLISLEEYLRELTDCEIKTTTA